MGDQRHLTWTCTYEQRCDHHYVNQLIILDHTKDFEDINEGHLETFNVASRSICKCHSFSAPCCMSCSQTSQTSRLSLDAERTDRKRFNLRNPFFSESLTDARNPSHAVMDNVYKCGLHNLTQRSGFMKHSCTNSVCTHSREVVCLLMYLRSENTLPCWS